MNPLHPALRALCRAARAARDARADGPSQEPVAAPPAGFVTRTAALGMERLAQRRGAALPPLAWRAMAAAAVVALGSLAAQRAAGPMTTSPYDVSAPISNLFSSLTP